MFSWDLLANAVVAGLLIGGFYAAVSLGVGLIFGLLDIANIAQPAFVILGSYAAYVLNNSYGIDPILTGLLLTPVFYVLGAVVYRVYYGSFERRGEESLRGLVFFFGLLFIIEVSLSIIFGVDYRLVQTWYGSRSIEFGGVGVAFRYARAVHRRRRHDAGASISSWAGRSTAGPSWRCRRIAWPCASWAPTPSRSRPSPSALGIAAASLAGALLISIAPVIPSTDRDYIGRMFAITVLGGMGSIGGTLVAGIVLGIAESLMATFFGPSWSLAVSFGILLLALAVRPAGLFGR